MIERIYGMSPQLAARIAGGLYAVIFLVAPSGAKGATAVNVAVTMSCDTAVALLFYVLFRRVNKGLSLIAAIFRIVFVVVMTVNSLNYFGVLDLFQEGRSAASFNNGYDFALVPFGIHCLIVGYLILKSGFLPKIIGILLMLAGSSYLLFISPPLGNDLFVPYILAFAVLGEGSLTLYLIFFGVRVNAVGTE